MIHFQILVMVIILIIFFLDRADLADQLTARPGKLSGRTKHDQCW